MQERDLKIRIRQRIFLQNEGIDASINWRILIC